MVINGGVESDTGLGRCERWFRPHGGTGFWAGGGSGPDHLLLGRLGRIPWEKTVS